MYICEELNIINVADGAWRLIINYGRVEIGGILTTTRTLPSNGRLFLGQTPASAKLNPCCTFSGEISFINIWRRILTMEEVIKVSTDCKLSSCGDVVQWAEFRSGSRWAMKMRWPSGVFGSYHACYFNFPLSSVLPVMLRRSLTALINISPYKHQVCCEGKPRRLNNKRISFK